MTIGSGTAPFAKTGSYRFLGGADGNYVIFAQSKTVANSQGTYTYAKTGDAQGQLTYTDSVSGIPYVISLTLTSATGGTYSTMNGGVTYQTGHFALASGQAPASIVGYTIALVVQYGTAPLAVKGTEKIVTAEGGSYTLTGSGGATSSSGSYIYNNPTENGSTLSLDDSAVAQENVTLSWTSLTAGTYVADLSSGAVQAGTFSASAPPAPVITSVKTAVAGQGVYFSYQITASGLVESYNATNLPAGLSIDTSTGMISGTPTALGVTKITISASNVKTTSATLTLTVKTPVTITFANNTFSYTGKAQKANVTTSPAGEPVTFIYTQNGKTVSPVNVGTYDVAATVNTANAAGTQSGTLVITTGSATVTLGHLTAAYTGKPLAVTAATTPSGLPVSITYDGSATPPSDIGIYNDVVATVTSPNYTGSATGTFTITPVTTTGAATSVTGTTAVLNGTVSPKAQVTSVSFEYGTDTSYGNSVSGTIGGSSATIGTVTGSLTGLTGSTPYHFRLDVQSAAGLSVGADHTFTTLKVPGSTFLVALGSASGVEVSYRVTAGSQALKAYFEYGTADGSYTTGTTFMQSVAANAVVTVTADIPGLAANVTYHYRLVLVSAGGTTYGPDETYTTSGFDTTAVASTGTVAPDTSGATWDTLNAPALNDADGVAFTGYLTTGSGTGTVTSKNDFGVWANDSSGNLHLVARTDGDAPGTAPAATDQNPNPIDDTFFTFGTPLYNDNADVTFSGEITVASGVATAANSFGVWQYRNGSGNLVARIGFQAPGCTTGTNFSTFSGIGLTQSAGTILFASLTGTSTAVGVTAANDFAIFEGSSQANLAIKLRLGDSVPYVSSTGTITKVIKQLDYLTEEYLTSAQTRNFNASGSIAANALFTDKTNGIQSNGLVTVVGSTKSIAELNGGIAPGVGNGAATWGAFGVPCINNSNHIAFDATLVSGVSGITSATSTGIWAQNSAGTLENIAQSGIAGQAPLDLPNQGSDVDSFYEFSDVVYNNNDAVAFAGVLNEKTGLVTGTNQIGIYCNSAGSLQLMVREGEQAPGCPTGAKFSSFTTLVLPDANGATNKGGLAFIGTLASNAAAGVSEGNDTGIWAVDRTGTLQLIVRVGDVINGKTVIGLTFLPFLSGSDGQTRSVAAGTGDLVYVAAFSDKSSAIFNVVFPQ